MLDMHTNNFFDYLLIEQIADAYEELDDVSECREVILSSQKTLCWSEFGQDEDMLDKWCYILSYMHKL